MGHFIRRFNLGHKYHQNHPNRVSQRMTQFTTAGKRVFSIISICVQQCAYQRSIFQTFSLDSRFPSAVASKTIDSVLNSPPVTDKIKVTFVATLKCRRCQLSHGSCG